MFSRALFTALVLSITGVATARADEAAAAPSEWNVDSAGSTLKFHVVHKLHKVDGASKKLEGKARLTPAGQVQVMLRAPAESFDSGNVNRDAHMKEVIEAARFPQVELKAIGEGVTTPTSFPSTVEKKLRAQVTLHGVSQALEIPVKIVFDSEKKAHATSSFTLSLDAFKVERPALMFVKVDDALVIDADVLLTR